MDRMKAPLLKQIKISDPQQHTNRLLSQMKKDLRLQVLPDHIECFDNSNIHDKNQPIHDVFVQAAYEFESFTKAFPNSDKTR